MKTLLIYLAGVATPFVFVLCFWLYFSYIEWREDRRYKRAWELFGQEFDNLTADQLADCKKLWKSKFWHYERMHSDRDRYFSMRWEYGNTNAV